MLLSTKLMFRSLAALLTGFVTEPLATLTTFLYCSDHLPRDLGLERLVQTQLLHPENYLFHFIVNIFKCFW